MARKVVGITCSTLAEEAAPVKQALNRAYVRAIENAGGAVLILPVTREPEALARYLGAVDGLLLSGGVDIAPERYGQKPHPKLGEVDADRDATELPLLREALAQDMPVFAICRGCQALNVALGGALYQDILSELPGSLDHQQTENGLKRTEFSHTIQIVPDSRLRGIVGAEEMPTNSLHHQALRDTPSALIVAARAPDGVIEAVESATHRFVLGVQFHPEETAPHDAKSRRLFEAFLAAL